MRKADNQVQRMCARTVLFSGALLTAMVSSGAADASSLVERALQEPIPENVQLGTARETTSVSTEERAKALRQQKINALDSLNQTIKQLEDREESRAIRDGRAFSR